MPWHAMAWRGKALGGAAWLRCQKMRPKRSVPLRRSDGSSLRAIPDSFGTYQRRLGPVQQQAPRGTEEAAREKVSMARRRVPREKFSRNSCTTLGWDALGWAAAH